MNFEEMLTSIVGGAMVAGVAYALREFGFYPGWMTFFIWAAVAWLALGGFVILANVVEKFRPRTQLATWELAILEAIDSDLSVLARKKYQLTGRNDFGRAETAQWEKEWDQYARYEMPSSCRAARATLVDTIWRDLLDRSPEQSKVLLGKEISRRLDARVQEIREDYKKIESASPVEFEHKCMEALNALGWTARVTKASGDQGADVIATYDDEVLVIQCKLYSRPVGNKAVQEVVAAREHYRADYAAVVTNASFTRAARDLAQTSKTRLVEFSELERQLSPEVIHLQL